MVTVLCYHGVTVSQSVGIENFAKKHLPLHEFERQIQSLADNSCHVISLESFLARLSDQAFSGNEVVLSFDDGYKSHYELVWPLLRDYQMPFTVFVPTGFLSQDRLFWVDLVEHWINRTRMDTVSLLLPQGQRTWQCTSAGERVTAVIEIKKCLKKLRPTLRDEILEQLREITQVSDPPGSVENYRCMSWDDLVEMVQDPLVTVGSHSVNHEILPNLTPAEAEFEIVQSKHTLERRIGRPVVSFAYPNGKPRDYNPVLIDLLKSAGYSCAFKVVPDSVPDLVRTYELARIADDELDRFFLDKGISFPRRWYV
jgi:peptidoglycan/xylan/chitin deacetylase (PgdA/CDA1 family)